MRAFFLVNAALINFVFSILLPYWLTGFDEFVPLPVKPFPQTRFDNFSNRIFLIGRQMLRIYINDPITAVSTLFTC
jgi:hypothetical protein